MLSTGMIIFIVWAIGTVVALIPVCRFCVMFMDEDEHDPMMIACAIMLGMCVACFWPLFIPGYWIYKVIQMDREAS